MKRLNKQHLLTMAAVFFAAVFVFSAVMLYRECQMTRMIRVQFWQLMQ